MVKQTRLSLSIRMWNQGDLVALIVGSRQGSLSVLQTADLLGLSECYNDLQGWRAKLDWIEQTLKWLSLLKIFAGRQKFKEKYDMVSEFVAVVDKLIFEYVMGENDYGLFLTLKAEV